MLTSKAADHNFLALIAEHHRLVEIWRQSKDEQVRRAMAAAWSVGITHPGSSFGERVELGGLCRPTILTCHWLPAAGEDYWTMLDHLGYRGACLGCGWVSDTARRGRGAENLAVEDVHEHTHPGGGASPSLESPAAYSRQLARWQARWGHLLPEAWLQSGGPIRTRRPPPSSRHVPGRAPGGGYDLAVDEQLREEPGGQLALI